MTVCMHVALHAYCLNWTGLNSTGLAWHVVRGVVSRTAQTVPMHADNTTGVMWQANTEHAPRMRADNARARLCAAPHLHLINLCVAANRLRRHPRGRAGVTNMSAL